MKNSTRIKQAKPVRFVTVGETSLSVIPPDEKPKLPAAAAAVIMAAVIALALFVGPVRSLAAGYSGVKKAFYDGSRVSDGYSINDDLIIIGDEAYNMAALGEQVLGDNANVGEVKRLVRELSEAGTISEKYTDYTELTYASSRLYSELSEETALTETQSRLIKQCYTEIQSRKKTIENNEYNELAEEYNKKISGFPASLIGKLIGLKEAELFK